MPLSWNEIKQRSIRFAREWDGITSEKSERQSFWNSFFDVFGVSRRRVAAYEEPVKNLSGHYGFIDLLWPGTLIVEHKSAGQDLDKANSQAMAYIRALADEGRDKEIPRYVIVSDFARIRLYDLEPEDQHDLKNNLSLLENGHLERPCTLTEFHLADLHKNIRHFAFIAGYKQHRLDPEDPANEEATALMCELHDALADGGYEGHELRRFLVRILFCLFGEDTGIFPPNSFELYIKNHTRPDGADLGPALARLFDVLNTPVEHRQKNLDEDLAQFPYVNGDLFAERLGFADFNADMRARLLICAQFRWERISPAVFGALFQSVMDDKARRQIGAHYTAEKNILKLIRSLFLDDLRDEFAALKNLKIGKQQRLEKFHAKLAALTFLDPACGCGNFLVITYRELRKLELELLRELHPIETLPNRELSLDAVNALSKLNVHQFYGIEIEEFPARIAEVGLWLTDHQANVELSHAFSQLVLRLPLRASPHIHVANALRTDWREILPPEKCSYILGNPPFVGKQHANPEQKADMEIVWGDTKGCGVLDFVTCWYRKAADYMHGERAQPSTLRAAFVSTNSITQGEQVGVLWGKLFSQYKINILFAHRTFAWESESKGKAHVHVVIIGFGLEASSTKRIYDYEHDENNPTISIAKNISPYLLEGGNTVIVSRTNPICQVPEIIFGSMPNDGGNLLLSTEEKNLLLKNEPHAEKFIRPFLGAEEFINGAERWCLWLKDAAPHEYRIMPEIMRRIEGVREHRINSSRPTTRELAKTPMLFGENRQPETDYLLVPLHTSETRTYIPLGLISANIIVHNSCAAIPDATLYHFGVLSSAMHMAWTKQVCGRLESRYRYSNKLVYNNYPWPQNPTDKQRTAIEEAAQAILDVRAKYPASTLADLYDPLAMPPDLHRAHEHLDRLVERCYRSDAFENDRARVEYLFHLYEQLANPLLPSPKTHHRKFFKTIHK